MILDCGYFGIPPIMQLTCDQCGDTYYKYFTFKSRSLCKKCLKKVDCKDKCKECIKNSFKDDK